MRRFVVAGAVVTGITAAAIAVALIFGGNEAGGAFTRQGAGGAAQSEPIGYAEIAGIEGPHRTGAISVLAIEWGVASAGSGAGGGGGGGTPNFDDFTFLKPFDQTTPELALACASGRVFPRALIQLGLPDGGVEPSGMRYVLQDVQCTRDRHTAPEPVERVSLTYGRITWRFPLPGGGLRFIETCWNVRQNRTC